MVVEQLWTKYQKKRTDEHRNDLVMYYLPLARLHVNRVQLQIEANHLSAELFGAASLGLIQAVEAFDPKRNHKFATFSWLRIRGAMIDWLREIDPQVRVVRQFERKQHSVAEALAHNNIHDSAAIAEKMDISYERYLSLDKRLTGGRVVYLSTLSQDQDWTIEDKNSLDPARTVSRSFLQEFICKGLKRAYRMVLVLHYFEGLNMREIADIMNFSSARICQLRKEAIDCVRKKYPNINCWPA